MDKLTIILIAISAVVALSAAFFQYLFKVKEKSQYLYWLSFFRAIALFCLLLLLINPSIKKTNYTNIKPQLNVVVDNSKSIEHLQNNGTVESLLNRFQNSQELSNKFEVQYYKFGSKLETLDSLDYSDSYSNLSKVFSIFSEIGSDSQEAFVLITDGNETAGNTNLTNNSKGIIYPVVVGDTTVYEDLSLDRLNVNPTTFLNNNAPVEVFVNYTGTSDISKELSLYEGSTKIASKQVNLTRTQNATSVSFFIPATKEGRHYYSARIGTLDDEKNTENNIKSFALNVIKEQAKILILSNLVHPDLRMLKASIGANKERDISIKNTSEAFDVNEFDLVILYQPTDKFESIFKLLDEREINYLLVSGLSTDWNFLNSAQTNYSRETIASEENFSAIFNEDYSTFLTDPIEADEWPPLQNFYGKLTINSRFNTLLFQSISGIQTKEPILGTFEIGNQKVGLLMGENSWRWRIYSYKETGSFEVFDEFISNLVQYLSSKKQKNRLNVSLKDLFYANEAVEFTASYLDDNLNFDPKAQIEVTITKVDGDFSRTVPFTAYSNTFKAALSDLSEGTYNYTVRVIDEAISKSGTFKIAAYNLEEQFSSSQWQKLQQLATESGGNMYFENDSEEIINDLIANEQFKTIQLSQQEKTPLIEWQFLLIAIVSALALEWFTRKYFGKI